MNCSKRIVPFVLAVLWAVTGYADTFSGKVVGVLDGDTFGVMGDPREVKVLLHGINCPESHRAFGTKVKQFTSEQFFDTAVVVELRDTDPYGRLVGGVTPVGRPHSESRDSPGRAWLVVSPIHRG